jgi:hypothetical protein
MRTTGIAARLTIVASLTTLALAFGGCSSAKEPDPTATTTEDLYGLGSLATKWTNGVVPVCFQSLTDHASLQSQIPYILSRTWSAAANITFTGFGACPSSGNYVTIEFSTQTNFRGNTSSLGQGNPIITLVSDDTSTNLAHFQYEVIHEMGHALGFAHEMQRPDNWVGGNALQCPPTPNDYGNYAPQQGGVYLTTAYDSASIMNYCDPNLNQTIYLSLGDILGVKQAYGDSGLPVVTAVSPSSGPYSGGTVVTITGRNFNTAGQTTVYFGSYTGLKVSCPTTTTCYATTPRDVPNNTVDVQVAVAGIKSTVATCLPVGPGSGMGCSLPVTQDQYTFTSQCVALTESQACTVTISGKQYTEDCGNVSDGCGGTVSCGTCASGYYCDPSYGYSACEVIPQCPGGCPPGDICENGVCVVNHRCMAGFKYCNGKCIPQSSPCL